MKIDQSIAKQLLDGLNKTTEKANKDKRSDESYWNGDDWGSISGFHDAQNWVKDQQIEFIVDFFAKMN